MIPTLYLIPSPLGETFLPETFSNEIKSIIEKLDYFIVENEKRHEVHQKDRPEKTIHLKLFPLNKHTSAGQ